MARAWRVRKRPARMKSGQPVERRRRLRRWGQISERRDDGHRPLIVMLGPRVGPRPPEDRLRPTIQVFRCRSRQRRGWCAFAHHDDPRRSRTDRSGYSPAAPWLGRQSRPSGCRRGGFSGNGVAAGSCRACLPMRVATSRQSAMNASERGARPAPGPARPPARTRPTLSRPHGWGSPPEARHRAGPGDAKPLPFRLAYDLRAPSWSAHGSGFGRPRTGHGRPSTSLPSRKAKGRRRSKTLGGGPNAGSDRAFSRRGPTIPGDAQGMPGSWPRPFSFVRLLFVRLRGPRCALC